jgi:DNA-binding response OmpR family regulator
MARVLLVEDDPRLRVALVRALELAGHAVAAAATGLDGLRAWSDVRPDIVVLDLGLPDVDGVELIKMLRAVSDVPVVVATARDDDESVVAALSAGGDDYVVKPFSGPNLDARITAVLRRAGPDEAPRQLQVGELVVDLPGRAVTLRGQPLDLSPKEFDLLAHLAARPGVVVSKRDLLRDVWQQPYGGADRTVDVHLSWLRRKLGESAREPRYLVSVRGVGVKLVAPGS